MSMFFTLLFVAIAGLHGCGGGGGSAPSASPVNKVLESITIEPSAETTVAGTPKTFTAYGHYSDSATPVDISTQVDWSSSSETVPLALTTVDGKIFISSDADIIITASKDFKSDTATLTVTPAPPPI